MRNLTSRFVALATASALIAGCSTQEALTPQASAASVAAPGAPIEFRVVPEESNPTGCKRFDAQLSRGHTFRATGNTASLTSASSITSNMTQTSPGVYTQPSIGRSQAVTRRHRDDARDQAGGRGARHFHPRPPRDRPQGPCELQEPGAAILNRTTAKSGRRLVRSGSVAADPTKRKVGTVSRSRKTANSSSED